MSLVWIVRCANPRCRHVCLDTDWVQKPKENPSETDIALRVKQSHCPKCDCKTYYKATENEIKKAGLTPPADLTPVSSKLTKETRHW